MIKPIIFLLAIFSMQANAQKKITSREVTEEIVFATVDRVGELYVLTEKGQIQKFGIDGDLISLYKNGPRPTLFEPRDGSRLFAFFRMGRKIQYLNPSFEVSSGALIDSAFVIDPWLACSSGDHNLWVLDAEDMTMKKINTRTANVDVDVTFPENLSHDFSTVKSIREYQGFFFLLDSQKGIYIFNGMGKLIKTIAHPDLPYFNFLGEELYYPSQNGLTLLNLFSGEKREIPLKKTFKFALVTDERMFLVQTNSIDFFEFEP
ncbi:MAG TPA: hypothetical protein VFZ52_15410 [Chryseolinea sp.]